MDLPRVRVPESPKEDREDEDYMPNETDALIERDDTETLESDSETLSVFSANSAKSALTYKQLSDNVFFWTALILHMIALTLAITI